LPDDAKRVILINAITRAMEWGTYIAMSQDCAAEEIADLLLFETGTALLAGDFDRFSACFGLPHVIETADTRSVIRDLTGLRKTFDELRRYYRDTQVVDVVRTVVEARFIDCDTVGSTHVASIVHAYGVTRRKPYPVYSVIRRHDPLDWRIMSSLYVILDSETHNDVLSVSLRPSEVSG
jgi:hypothetical protein